MRKIRGGSHPGGHLPELWLMVAVGTVLTGCAVNDVGAVQVGCRESATARVVTLEAWGAHLVAGSGDSSLTLGRSRRSYVYPRDVQSGGEASFADIREAASMRSVACEDLTFGATEPIARTSRIDGVSLDFNGSRAGVALGARSRTAVRIDGGNEGMTVYLDGAADGGAAWVGRLER